MVAKVTQRRRAARFAGRPNGRAAGVPLSSGWGHCGAGSIGPLAARASRPVRDWCPRPASAGQFQALTDSGLLNMARGDEGLRPRETSRFARATAIAFAQKGRKRAQPLIHHLLRNVLATMGIQLLNVTISTLADGIFDCHLSLSNHRTVGARPSDAIALAIWAGAPILVGAELLDEAGVSIADDAP